MYETSYRDLLNHPVRFCYKTVQGGIPRPELDSPEILLLSPESYSLSGWSGHPPPPKTPTSRVWAGMGGVSTPGIVRKCPERAPSGEVGCETGSRGGQVHPPPPQQAGVGQGKVERTVIFH